MILVRRFALGAVMAVIALAACTTSGKLATSGSGPCPSPNGRRAFYACIVKNGPNDQYGWYDLGVIDQRAGNTNKAVSDYLKAIAIQSNFESALYNLGVLRLQARDYSAAITLLTRAVTADEKDTNAHLNLSRALANLHTVAGNTRSKVELTQARKLDPKLVPTPPPDVVNGIPLRRLATLVRSPAAAWSEPHPFNIRAAVGSDRAANALMGQNGDTYNFGETARAYVVALDGHFSCEPPRCSTSGGGPTGPQGLTQSPTTTTTRSAVPVSTMLLTFAPKTLQEVGGFRVVGHEVDMNKLGRVYSLDQYR